MGKASPPSNMNTVQTTTLLNQVESSSESLSRVLYNNTSETYAELTERSEIDSRSWNLSKTTVTAFPEKLTTLEESSKNVTHVLTTTTNSYDEFGPPEGVEYIFVPLGVMVFVIILSAVVLIVSRKRKLERLRHRLMPMYNFDGGDEEEDDWETELLDECYSSHQRCVSRVPNYGH